MVFKENGMIFEQIATGGCQSYLIGCSETSGAALIISRRPSNLHNSWTFPW